MAQYTYTGYDASAHVAEETKNASRAAPRGIVTSVLVSVIGGFILLYSITAAITDNSEAGLAALSESETGLPPAQIFLDSLNSPTVAKFLLFIVCVAQFFCGMASVTANSRMSYAFSRDNALPGSRIWAKVNPRTGTPTNSIWLCVVLSIILASPALVSTTAYFAVTSIAVIGLYIAYVDPGAAAPAQPRLHPGPVEPRPVEPVIGWVAVVWVVIICILFVLPPVAPGRRRSTFNYAPIAVLVVLVFALVSWQVSGKKNFMHGAKDEHTTVAKDEVLDWSDRCRMTDRTCWPTPSSAPLGGGTPSRTASSGWPRPSGSGSTRTAARCRPSASSPPGWASPGPRCGRRSPPCARPGWCGPPAGRGGGTVVDHEPTTPGDPSRRPLRRASRRSCSTRWSSAGSSSRAPAYLAASRPLTAAQRAMITEALRGGGRRRPTRPSTGRPTPGCTWRIAALTGSAQLVDAVTSGAGRPARHADRHPGAARSTSSTPTPSTRRSSTAILAGDGRPRPPGDGEPLRRHGRPAAGSAAMSRAHDD